MASSKKRNSSKKPGVEAFEDEDVEDEELDEDLEDEDETDEEDDDSDDDSSNNEDEEEDEDGEPQDVGFAPFIVSENQEWELADVLSEATEGDDVFFYVPPSDDNPVAKWYKLSPVNIGEVVAAQS